MLLQFPRYPPLVHTVDMVALADLAESFSFSKICKRTTQSRFCSVLYDTTNDHDTLFNCGGIVLPMGQMPLYVTFAPSMDNTLRTSLPREARIALPSHKAVFYKGAWSSASPSRSR